MNSGSFMKKIIGLILFFVAIGMLLMMVIHNRLIGLIILALLLFAGYYLFSSCEGTTGIECGLELSGEDSIWLFIRKTILCFVIF